MEVKLSSVEETKRLNDELLCVVIGDSTFLNGRHDMGKVVICGGGENEINE